MDCGTPGFPVLHCLLEFAQPHVHGVSDAVQPSHQLLPPSPFALTLAQHQNNQNKQCAGNSLGALTEQRNQPGTAASGLVCSYSLLLFCLIKMRTRWCQHHPTPSTPVIPICWAVVWFYQHHPGSFYKPFLFQRLWFNSFAWSLGYQ